MKEKILEFLKENSKPQSLIDINHFLNLRSVEDLNLLEQDLNGLVTSGLVHENKNHEYILMEKTRNLKAGELHINSSGNGFIDQKDEKDIFIKNNNLNGAINGDFVVVEIITRLDDPEPEGHIIKILRRDLKNVVGEIVKSKKDLIFKPDDEKLDIIVKLSKETIKGCVEGHKVIARIEKEIRPKVFLAHVIKIIGHKNDPGVDILTVAAKHNIFPEFSDDAIKELENILNEVDSSELIGRKDLTNEMIFTIDGDDTKDIDDAISVEKDKDNYRLGVHIADVSHYLKINSALYNDAFERGTSSYLADTVIPMIPHQLSNGICSLNPEVVRLTISCSMLINPSGKVIDYDIFPSYIKSRKQMTYKCVNKILEENTIPEGYEEYADKLKTMYGLSKILRAEKNSRGYINFNETEAKVVQDKNGKAIDIVKRQSGAGEKLIEDFMIAANETVAMHISNMELPFIYRVHDLPNSEKIDDFVNFVHQMGYSLKTNVTKMSPKTMDNILKELKDKKEYAILSDLLLRSMKKAIYSTNNIGHFGLASKYYTHFTSPIRRFPDLTVHRLLRTYLFEKRIDTETIDFNTKYLPDIAEHSSEREVAATEAERDVFDMKVAEYMEDKIGTIYKGIISSVTNFGMFVTINDIIDGLVHISNLDGYYTYVPEILSLVKQDKSKKYRLGDEVSVKVISANKDLGKVDFEIVGDSDGNKK